MEVLLNRDHSNSWRAALAHVARSGGWRGFWKGNILNCVRTAPFKAVNFFTFDRLNRLLTDWSGGAAHGYERFVAGAGAGITATVLCIPLDVLRTRMMSPHGGHPKSVAATLYDMVVHEGIGSFYTGCVPAMLSMALGGAVFYGTYDALKSHHLRARHGNPGAPADGPHPQRLDSGSMLLYGALAGLVAEVVTYPFEVVRRKMQLERVLASRAFMASKGLTKASLVKASFSQRLMIAIQMSTHQHGLRGLYAGMLPNALQVLPSAALGYYVYEMTKVFLAVKE